MSKFQVFLNWFFGVTAVLALVIALINFKIDTVGQADYVAISVTILCAIVSFAVGYNIYTNIGSVRKVAADSAEAVARKKAEEMCNKTKEELEKKFEELNTEYYTKFLNLTHSTSTLAKALLGFVIAFDGAKDKDYKESLDDFKQTQELFKIAGYGEIVVVIQNIIDKIFDKLNHEN